MTLDEIEKIIHHQSHASRLTIQRREGLGFISRHGVNTEFPENCIEIQISKGRVAGKRFLPD
jgi:hypothetical protein